MCEAEFANREALIRHIDLLHGQYRFFSIFLSGCYSLSAYCVSPTEKRSCVEHFASAQKEGTLIPENEPFVELLDPAVQRKQLWAYLYGSCANQEGAAMTQQSTTKLIEANTWASAGSETRQGSEFDAKVHQEADGVRGFVACVFCAMLHWSEHWRVSTSLGHNVL